LRIAEIWGGRYQRNVKIRTLWGGFVTIFPTGVVVGFDCRPPEGVRFSGTALIWFLNSLGMGQRFKMVTFASDPASQNTTWWQNGFTYGKRKNTA